MAQMLIILRRDPNSGKQNIVIKLDSDPDALPIEHESMHKALVEKLIGKGIAAEDLGEIVIEREGQSGPAAPVGQPGEKQAEKAAQGN